MPAAGARRGEVEDGGALGGRKERAAKGIARGADDAAAMAGEAAHMGQGPAIEQNRRESCGNHRAAATDITNPGRAHAVDDDVAGIGHHGRGAVPRQRTDMAVAQTRERDHLASPALWVKGPLAGRQETGDRRQETGDRRR